VRLALLFCDEAGLTNSICGCTLINSEYNVNIIYMKIATKKESISYATKVAY
jgi:hypothetical protein